MLRRGAHVHLFVVTLALALIGVPASAGDAQAPADPAKPATTVRVDLAKAAHAAALRR